MYIHEVRVSNFRSILDESLACDSLTVLVGRNGSGKSSFLSALEHFYDPSAKITLDDFYAQDVSQDIEIAVTFSGLNADEKVLFSSYVQDDALTIVRIFSDPDGGKSGTYHGMRLQSPDFASTRNANGNMNIRREYNKIRQTPEYSTLPTVTAAAAALAELTKWESRNPEQCSHLRDDGQFFGFTGVAQGYLGRYTRFICVPAVRDAHEEATEGRGSSVTVIMDLVVRSALARRKDLADFRQNTQDRYREIMNPRNLQELSTLAQDLSNTLRSYVPDAGILLDWSEFAEISIPMPQAQVKLLEDDYESRVEKAGHGLQRAFIVTMLQHLAAVRSADTVPEDENSAGQTSVEPTRPHVPSLVLAIEEPELYQHPSRQRHLAAVLLRLATGAVPGVAKDTQVIYATHSPLFVGLDRFDQIRALRKVAHVCGKPNVTQLKKASLDRVADELWNAHGRALDKFTAETLRPRLQALMTPWMNEGFFADVVVLVEGEEDRAAILGVANSMSHDFDGMGITIIPCFGKTNLDRPLVIFRQLGVSVYVVWDGDYDVNNANPELNSYLLRLVGQPEQDWPDFVGDSSACFKFSLGKTLEGEIGKESFAQWLSEAQGKLDIAKKDQALKNAAVIQHVIENAGSNGKSSKTLESIVESIVALKSETAAYS